MKKFITASALFLSAVCVIAIASYFAGQAWDAQQAKQVMDEYNLPYNWRSEAIRVVKSTLRDPMSAQISNVRPIKNGAIVTVNAKNGFGAYTGFQDKTVTFAGVYPMLYEDYLAFEADIKERAERQKREAEQERRERMSRYD